MKKTAMVMEMIDNNYIDIFYYGGGSTARRLVEKGRLTTDDVKERAIHYLQYHVLKEQIEEFYKRYLTWKACNVIL